MNFKRHRVDGTMGFASMLVFALLAAGLRVIDLETPGDAALRSLRLG